MAITERNTRIVRWTDRYRRAAMTNSRSPTHFRTEFSINEDAVQSPRILKRGLPSMLTAVPPLKFKGYIEYFPGSFRRLFTPLSLRLISSISVFWISSPATIFLPPSPSTDRTRYHLGPRFIYEYSCVTSLRGDKMRFLRLVSL